MDETSGRPVVGQNGGMYDCRLHLLSAEMLDIVSGTQTDGSENGNDCSAELLEEEMCDEERYKDMLEDIKRLEEEEEKRKGAEIAFNYAESGKAESSSSEEEVDEPFQPPGNVKLPLGMNLPDTMKQNAVIERTATFVVAQGPQMEIVIKAKQRGNLDQFGFLEFDHPLNAYYKYISKLIREKKYVPQPHIPKRRPKLKKLKRLEEKRLLEEQQQGNDIPGKSSDSDTDSDSDNSGNYLHPLLMGGARKTDSRSSSPVIGPKTKEEHEASPRKQSQVKTGYKLGKADDMYSSLFKNLSDLVAPQTKTSQAAEVKAESDEKTKKELDKGDYYEWYLSFYGEPPPSNEHPSVIPPPPDIMPTVNNAAEYVARYGMQAEQILLGRHDLNLGFLNAGEPYYGYYHSRVRYYQQLQASYMQIQKVSTDVEEEPSGVTRQEVIDSGEFDVEYSSGAPGDDFICEQPSTSAFADLLQAPPPPPPFMNRKMRRRGFHDPPRTSEASAQIAEVGLIDPEVQMSKTQSSPALLDFAGGREENGSPSARKVPSGPISFSLNVQKADDKKLPKMTSAAKLGAYEDEENSGAEMMDVPPGVLTNIPPPGLTIPPPPVAPVPLSTGQLAVEGSAELQSERKLKARLFMEKILNEKRAAKLRAQNEEQQKREIELLKKYEETHGASTSPMSKSKGKGNGENLESVLPTSEIDQLISSRIDKVLNETFGEKGEPKHSKSHYKREKKRRKGRHHNSHSSDEEPSKHRRPREDTDSSERKPSKKKSRKKRRHQSSSSEGSR